MKHIREKHWRNTLDETHWRKTVPWMHIIEDLHMSKTKENVFTTEFCRLLMPWLVSFSFLVTEWGILPETFF